MDKKISAVLNVHNAEETLERCLSSLKFVNEIVIILDNCTDESLSISKKFTKKIFSGSWEYEGDRRNFGIENCSYEWILEIDADEFISENLSNEILKTIRNNKIFDNFHIKVDNYIGDKLVKFGWGATFGRGGVTCLFKKGTKFWGKQRVHPEIIFNGKMGPNLKNPIRHEFVKNISDLFQKFNNYTHLKALDLIESKQIHQEYLFRNVRRVITRFLKNYFKRKGYKEKHLGFLIAVFAGSFPLISYLRAKIYLMEIK